jgi:hypothetical protein
MAKAKTNPTTRPAKRAPVSDPIFDLINKHRAIAAKIIENDKTHFIKTDRGMLELLQRMDRAAWDLLERPPVTVGGAEALLRYSVEHEAALEIGWPDGAPKSARPRQKWTIELRKVLAAADDSELLRLETEISKLYAAAHEIGETRIDPHNEGFDRIVSDVTLSKEQRSKDLKAFAQTSGRDAAIYEQQALLTKADKFIQQMWGTPARTGAGRAAKVRVLLQHVTPDAFAVPFEDMDWDAALCFDLLLEFAGADVA